MGALEIALSQENPLLDGSRRELEGEYILFLKHNPSIFFSKCKGFPKFEGLPISSQASEEVKPLPNSGQTARTRPGAWEGAGPRA